MVEAAITLPIVILTVALMLRLFAFYLAILDTQVEAHIRAANTWASYNKAIVNVYRDHKTVRLVDRGLLRESIVRDVVTEAYLINEDAVIRTGELFREE